MRALSAAWILSCTILLSACATTKVQTINRFESIDIPSSLYKCEQLLKSELPRDPIKNSDVHTLIENLLTKNAECRSNTKAIKKIVDDYNSKVAELNKKQPTK